MSDKKRFDHYILFNPFYGTVIVLILLTAMIVVLGVPSQPVTTNTPVIQVPAQTHPGVLSDTQETLTLIAERINTHEAEYRKTCNSTPTTDDCIRKHTEIAAMVEYRHKLINRIVFERNRS